MKNLLSYISIDSGSITLLVIIIIGTVFALFTKKETKEIDIRKISGEELSALMALNKNLKIIDVRNEVEFKEKHIANAINIPINYLSDKIKVAIPNLSELVVVYCDTGLRANIAQKIMKKIGYTKIYNLESMNKYFNKK